MTFYVFKRYSSKFPLLFSREKSRLRKIFPKAKIEHIGSSSVPGLGGKGIIDVIVSVPKKDYKRALLKLKREGYSHIIRDDVPKGMKFLKKFIKYSGNERGVHVHLTWENSKEWKSKIALREYLRKHKETAKKYEEFKREGLKYAGGDGIKYRGYKTPFLNDLTREAMKEYLD